MYRFSKEFAKLDGYVYIYIYMYTSFVLLYWASDRTVLQGLCIYVYLYIYIYM